MTGTFHLVTLNDTSTFCSKMSNRSIDLSHFSWTTDAHFTQLT